MNYRIFRSHGEGTFSREDFRMIGDNVVFEAGVLVFHPENISIGSNVYVGHYTLLKAYHENELRIGNDVWIGQNCFLHAAGGIFIEDQVGIGPGVMILTSSHLDQDRQVPIVFSDLSFAPVRICSKSDIGVGSIMLPGVTVGEGTQVGAGSVVTHDTPPYSVVAGVPARVIRYR